jgi:homoserine kinase type II
MAVLTPITMAEAQRLAAEYDLGPLGDFSGIPAGSVNSNFTLNLGGRRTFLRVYEEQDGAGAAREAAMLERLAASGVPTPPPLPRRDGGLVSSVRGKPAALFPWRDGVICCQVRVTERVAERLGRALAQVHVAGAGVPCQPGRFGYESLCDRLDGVARSGDARFVALEPGLRAALVTIHRARDARLPGGLIHSDLFRDNVLWDPEWGIAALLDFESACAGIYVYDLMVCVLSWCFGSDLRPELAQAMCRGYQQVRPLGESERDALLVEGSFAALRFTITRITDYAMRPPTAEPRVVKDWRRFQARFDKLQALGAAGLRRTLGV